MNRPQENPGIIDRAIEGMFPGWALRRAEARTRLNMFRGIGVEATHRGGISTRVSTSWPNSPSFKFGTTAGRWNQGQRRERARKVYQENAIGRGLLQTETDNVVAQGFRLQAKTSSPDFNREIEEAYEEWCDRADVRNLRDATEHERQVYRSPRRDGDGGVVLMDRGGASRVQYIPGDLICNPDGKVDPHLVDGVEVDDVGQPQAFHILDMDESGKREWTRVPAGNFIYLAPVIDDDLGIRGDSCYSQVFGYLDGLDGYIDAVVIAARMAAVFGLIFKEDNGQQNYDRLSLLNNSQGKKQQAITLENGMVKYVGKSDEVVQVVPQQPMNQTPDFVRMMARLIGVPFDMPLELVMKDMSQVNFASARIGLLGYYRACRSRQKTFRTTYLRRRYRWWVSREQKRQALGLPGAIVTKFPPDYWSSRFVSVGWDYTDPVSEAQGDQLQIDMGIKTPQMVAAERGRDWEEMQEELFVARGIRRLKKLDEVHSTMTRDAVVVPDAAPAADAVPATPADEGQAQ